MNFLQHAKACAVLMAVVAIAVGCQSSRGDVQARATTGATTRAATCDKCKVTTYKEVVVDQRGKVQRVMEVKSMDCPVCRSALANLLARGEYVHTCPICGEGAGEICAAH